MGQMRAQRPSIKKIGLLLSLMLLAGVGVKVVGQRLIRVTPARGATASHPLVELPEKARRLTVADHLKHAVESMQSSLPGAHPGPARAAQAAPRYTASAVRDPLQSLLPGESAPTASARSTAAHSRSHATRPPQPPPSLPTLLFQGRFWGGKAPIAIINGDVYGVGETVGGATIRAIDDRGVELEFGGATYLATTKGTTKLMSQGVSRR